MKVSREKFEELVSVYLDDETTPEERRLLSKCVRRNREMARIFHRECKIHAATCKIYGRKPRLASLGGIPNPLMPPEKYLDPSARAEWASVAILSIAAAVLFAYGTAAVFSPAGKNLELAKRGIEARQWTAPPETEKYFTGKMEISSAPDGSAVGILEYRR